MPTILIVDDDDVDRELAARCLEADGEEFEIRYAGDVEEALGIVEGGGLDVVLTDLRMPRQDGLELVEQLRDRFPQLPVILMTSRGNEQIAVAALKAGAASYVPKRRLKRDLADTVNQVVEMADARRTRRRVMRYLDSRETRFEVATDPKLIAPLVAFLQESLERVGFGSETLRGQVGMALSEALSNAMIHGNLEVSSELRQESSAEYYAMIDRRRREPPYAERRVRCVTRESRAEAVYVVRDEGPGFDPSILPDPGQPESLTRVYGRGLVLIRTFMDSVSFNAAGNEITMTKRNDLSDPQG